MGARSELLEEPFLAQSDLDLNWELWVRVHSVLPQLLWPQLPASDVLAGHTRFLGRPPCQCLDSGEAVGGQAL